MNKETLIIQINEREAVLAWLRSDAAFSDRPEIVRIPLEPGVIRQGVLVQEELLAEALRRYTSALPQTLTAVKTPAVFILNPLQGFCRTLILPWIPAQKREASVRYLLEDEYALEEEELWFTAVTLQESRADNVLHMMTGAARRAVLMPYVEVLNTLGWQVGKILFGAVLLAGLMELRDGQDTLVVDVDNALPFILLWRGTELMAARVFLPEELTGFAAWHCAGEVRRFLLYADRQYAGLNLHAIYAGGVRSAEVITDMDLPQEMEIRRIRSGAGWGSEDDEVAGDAGYFLAGGVKALSAAGVGKTPELDLMKRPLQRKKRQQLSLGLAVIWFGICLIGFAGHGWFTRYQANLQIASQTLQTQVAGVAARVKQEQAVQMQWQDTLDGEPSVISRLDQIEEIRQDAMLDYDEVVYREEEMTLKGKAASVQDARRLLASIQSLGWGVPTLTEYRQMNGEKIVFTIRVRSAKQ
ncbi:MAG: hypothetical protein LBT32_09900 [Peptococcaceae bacterium]|jgi:hypothetical protein|nr:hypothetical protein [Peptococcaceae bacterium]